MHFRKYKLPMSCIIPFPKKGDASSAPDFGQGRQVLAVYPGTTALYRATVASHRKVKSKMHVNIMDNLSHNNHSTFPFGYLNFENLMHLYIITVMLT